jgi:hypothetical protein
MGFQQWEEYYCGSDAGGLNDVFVKMIICVAIGEEVLLEMLC